MSKELQAVPQVVSTGSKTIKISYVDRYIKDGIIRSDRTVTFFDGSKEIEANDFMRFHQNKHYMIENEKIDIHIIQIVNKDRRGY